MKIKKLFIYVITFIITIGILASLLVITTKIPNEKIKKNTINSALYFKNKEAYRYTSGDKFCYIEDNYADAILLGVIWNMKDDDALNTVMDSKYCWYDEAGAAYGLFMDANGMAEPNTDYTRYWHGSSMVIRPLLLFTSVDDIRNIGLAAIIVLSVLLIAVLAKKKMFFQAGAFAVSMVMIGFWTIRLSMEYQPMFILGLIMCIAFILFEKKGNDFLLILAVVSGVSTAFFDFLTTETLTILLPILFVFMLREQEERNDTLKNNIIFTIKSMVVWGISYTFTFLTKWTLATIVTGENKYKAALSSVGERVAGQVDNKEMSKIEVLFKVIPANLSTMFLGTSRVDWGNIIAGLIISAMFFGSIYYLLSSKKFNKDFTLLALFIGLLPYLRYLMLSNHSYLHEFFTYRAQLITIMAIFAIIWCNSNMLAKNNRKKL